LPYRFIKDVEVKGKTILLRAGIDLPVKAGNIISTRRLAEHAKTIKELSDKKAKVVVLAYQGRPKKHNFIPLEQHSKAVSELIKKPVSFFEWAEDFESAIKAMQDGDILFLDNTRFLPEEVLGVDVSIEEYSKTQIIQKLAGVSDFFVNNALSVSHRNQATIVGFSPLLPCFVGPILERELNALDKAKIIKGNRLLIIGGTKNKDSVKLVECLLTKNLIDTVLVGGLFGELFLRAKGIFLGAKEEFLKEKEFFILIDKAKKLLEKFSEKIILPVDVAIDVSGERKEILIKELPSESIIKDIGKETVKIFSRKLSNADLIIWNGPLGVYEEKAFLLGTKEIAQAVVNSNAFTVLGGGDTETALEKANMNLKRFNHFSLAGKAFLLYLSGEKLPGLIALEKCAFVGREASFVLQKRDLPSFLNELKKTGKVIVPTVNETGATCFQEFSNQELFLKERTFFSAKRFLIKPDEKLFFFKNKNKDYEISPILEKEKTILFGIRPCDTHAIVALDRIFLDYYCVDPFYSARRKNTFIIALQCNQACENGFCTSLKTDKPLNFDLLFFEREKDFLISVGSDKGKQFVSKKFFKQSKKQIPIVDLKCNKSIPSKNLKQTLDTNFEHAVWEQEGNRCLSCTNCTEICPTCYCFSIKEDFCFGNNDSERFRHWDSCQLQSFTTVAGGHAFRAGRKSRLRQFVMHKLSYFIENQRMQLCVGCGRCISACPVDIDITKIVNRIFGDKK
jgi:phosphoglycerate kinase